MRLVSEPESARTASWNENTALQHSILHRENKAMTGIKGQLTLAIVTTTVPPVFQSGRFMRLSYVFFLATACLGGCVSASDENGPVVSFATPGAASQGAASESKTARLDMATNVPLPPRRPEEFGGRAVLQDVAEVEEDFEDDDEPVLASGAPEPPPASASLETPLAAKPAGGPPKAKTKGPGYYAAYDNTVVNCFPEPLRDALNTIAEHYATAVEVTSGLRNHGRRGSLHRHCMAADIRVAGIAPSALATYAKTVPGINGVGTYRRTDVTHVDIRQEQMAWRY